MATAFPSGDEALRRGTLRVLGANGGLAGTAFCVTADGRLLTCHHVVPDDAPLELEDSGGRRWKGRRCSSEQALHRCDLALIQLERRRDEDFPAPVPLLSTEVEDLAIRARACLVDASAFRDTLALSGRLQGRSRIAYHGLELYDVVGHSVQGFDVERGMSGAAVWSDRFGAVVGVLAVSASKQKNVAGFAIALSQISDSEELAEVLELNDQLVQRRGISPNDLGIGALLAEASESALRTLADLQIFLPAKFVPREGVREAVRAFLDSPAPAFPIVSAAANGKTTLLADLATDSGVPSWLIRGTDIRRESPGEALQRLLRGGAGLPDEADFSTLARRCRVQPLLLLDALNEVPMGAAEIAQTWLPELVCLTRNAGWKLLFTTRPELFGYVQMPDGTFFSPQGNDSQKTGAFFLGLYTAGEAAQALRKYKVGRGLSRNIGRHPMMVRLAQDAGAEADRRSRVLKRFIDRLALGTRSSHGLHGAEVTRRLVALARRADSQSGQLAFDDPIVCDQAAFVASLVSENILEEVPDGYRFVFDEIKDYLLAWGIAQDIRAGKGPADLLGLPHPSDVVAMCLEILDDGPDQAVGLALAKRLAAACSTPADRERSFSIVVALPRTAEFDAIKRSFVEALAPMIRSNEHFISSERDLSVAFPPDAFDRLLVAAITQEHGYGWREKDVWSNWHRGATLSIGRIERGVPRLIHELLEDEERDGTEVLFGLLEDETRLRDSFEASVGSFALCMILAHRERIGFERVMEEVVLKERRGSGSLMDALSEENPAELLDLLQTMSEAKTLRYFPAVRKCWRSLLKAEATETWPSLRRDAADFFDRVADSISPSEMRNVVMLAASAQLPISFDVRAALEKMEAADVLDDSALYSAVQLGSISAEEALQTAIRLGQAVAFVTTLAQSWGSHDVPLPAVVEMTTEHVIGLETAERFAYALENLCYRVGLKEARAAGLMELIDRMIEMDREGRIVDCLVYPATSSEKAAPEKASFRDWLLRRLLKKAVTPELAFRLLRGLAESGEALRSRMPLAIEVSKRLDVDDMITLCSMSSNLAFEELAVVVRATIADRPPRSETEADQLARLAAILEDPDLSEHDKVLAVLQMDRS